MGKYLNFLKVAFQTQMIYRGSMSLRGVRDVCSVLFFVLLWSAIFQTKTVIAGFTFQSMITYYILAKIIDQIYGYEPGRLLTRDINTGDLANYLTKPIHYFLYLAFLTFGRRLARTAASFLIIGLVFIFLPRFVTLPQGGLAFLAFLVSGVLSWMLVFEFAFILGSFGFWVTSTSSLRTAFEQMTMALGGLWVPLNLFPAPAARLLNFLPFHYLYFNLVQIYQGKFSSGELVTQIAIQSAWVSLLFFVAVFVWRRGIRNFGAYGR